MTLCAPDRSLKPMRKYDRAPMPIGTVRVRLIDGKRLGRMVKVRMDGPKGERWMDYARWWWLQNRGPVPEGKRVAHLDGDCLNDDPSNFGLLVPGDIVFLAHERDPEMSRRNRVAAARATSVANRLRAATNRLRNWLPTRWYPVDFRDRIIYIEPRRSRWQIYAWWGVDCSAATWPRARAAALGWPGLGCMHACILAVLADARGGLPRGVLQTHVAGLRRLHGWEPFELSTGRLYSIASQCKWIRTAHRGSRHASYSLDRAAIAERNPPCKVIPVRGRDLDSDRFKSFEKRLPQRSAAGVVS